MDKSVKFSLDASAFTPFQAVADDITYTLGSKLVQQETTYMIDFKSEVPLEVDDPDNAATNPQGCFVKYNFPRELQVSAGKPGSFTGQNLMVTSSGGTTLTPVDSDLTSATGKFVTLQGCTNTALHGQRKVSDQVTVTFTNIGNPFSVRDTSSFNIEIFKSWDGTPKTGYSQKIIESPVSIITADKYEFGQVEQLQVTATNYTVQEHPTHNFEFDIQNLIPGTSRTDIQPAFHVLFPTAFIKDPNNAGNNVISISSVDGSFSVTGTPTFTTDVSLTYNTACQLNLCYVIKFNVASDIAAGKRVKIAIANLENPESIFPCGDMTISSMMQYTGDPQFYKIDSETIASNFIAQTGYIASNTMTATSVYGDLSTYANNQAYYLKFTSVHKIYQGGYIKVKIPETFQMSSESTAVALFYVRDAAGTNYATLEAVDSSGLFIIGNIQTEMPKDTVYTIRVGGLQNPRYIVSNQALKTPFDFTITTFDREGRTNANMEDNVIDIGKGAAVDITVVSQIDSFSVEAYNTTNGVSDKYFITWNTNIQTINGDKLIVTFPKQTTMSPTKSKTVFGCTGKNGITKVTCYFNKNKPQELVIQMD